MPVLASSSSSQLLNISTCLFSRWRLYQTNTLEGLLWWWSVAFGRRLPKGKCLHRNRICHFDIFCHRMKTYVLKMTTSDTVSDENFVKMPTTPFQCRHVSVYLVLFCAILVISTVIVIGYMWHIFPFSSGLHRCCWGKYQRSNELTLKCMGKGGRQQITIANSIWWLCLVPILTTRFASDLGYIMGKDLIGLDK